MQLILSNPIRPNTVVFGGVRLLMVVVVFWYMNAVAGAVPTARVISNDTVFLNHKQILVLPPLVTIETGKIRPPVVDFLEAEMTGSVDEDLFALLIETTKDSTRIVSQETRNDEWYKDELPAEVSPKTGCDKLRADAVLAASYSFVNMPMVSVNDRNMEGQVSELRAVFSIFDCSSGKTVWQKSHTVFVPMKNASYQELMKKMFDHIVKEMPYGP